jgi:hypothetical protein
MGHFNEENDYEPADLGGILRQAHITSTYKIAVPIHSHRPLFGR